MFQAKKAEERNWRVSRQASQLSHEWTRHADMQLPVLVGYVAVATFPLILFFSQTPPGLCHYFQYDKCSVLSTSLASEWLFFFFVAGAGGDFIGVRAAREFTW